jgi:hypothetical protein
LDVPPYKRRKRQMLTCSRIAAGLLLASLSCSHAVVLLAQEIIPAAKILVISREYTKPDKDGSPHQAVEGAYPRALAGISSSDRYYAAVSVSGPPRVLFFHGYDSYADWAQAQLGAVTNPSAVATLGRTNLADGELLSSKDYSVWSKRDDLSLNPGFRAGARLEVVIQYLVRPGHAEEFEELVKLYTDGYKGVPGMHWGTYEETYGSPGNAFLVIITHKSASELDAEDGNDDKFAAALGTEGLKKLALLEASCLESKQADLFFIDPKMSYPTERMLKADPEFWKPSQPAPQ